MNPSDQVTHPSEQDGLIAGLYLEREYPAEWYTAERLEDYARALREAARAQVDSASRR